MIRTNTKQIPLIQKTDPNGYMQVEAEGGTQQYADDDHDFEHLIFDIEEVECKMTDIEERERSHEASSAGNHESAGDSNHGTAPGH